MRPPIDGGTALVTGASSGIGRELARGLAGRVKALVLVARRTARLEELARELKAKHSGLAVHVLTCDLADREATAGLIARAEEAAGPIDVLVNNAGLGDIGLFQDSGVDKTLMMIEVNCVALTELTRAALPGMLARGRGGILNISSGFGWSKLPGFATYCATKHYVTAFSEILTMELRGTGVVVTEVCPGPVATEFEQVAGNDTGLAVPGFAQLSAEACARKALAGFSRGRARVYPGLIMKAAMLAHAWIPMLVYRLVMTPVTTMLRSAGKAKSAPSATSKTSEASKASKTSDSAV